MIRQAEKISNKLVNIAGILLSDYCNNCTFYELNKCDTKPINCRWLKLSKLIENMLKEIKANEQGKEDIRKEV